MKKVVIVVLISIVCFSFITFETKIVAENDIPYPEGYRMWTHIKTELIGPGNPNFESNGGYHHIYANAAAMQGYNSGYFPDGSVLIFDVLNTREHGGNTQEAGRKRLNVMVKDSLKYSSTGGWGYGEFTGDSHTQILTPTLKTKCFNYHSKRENYVFSRFRK